LALPVGALAGDLYDVKNGINRIVWDPLKTEYTNTVIPKFKVELVPLESPLYMIVDLAKSAGAAGQIEYVYKTDLIAGRWGAWVQNPITNANEVIIWTGVATNEIYKTNKLVMRRLTAGTYGMGTDTNIPVTLTKIFFAGVFEVTEAQWAKIMGGGSASTKPQSGISYFDLRENPDNSDDPLVDWPSNTVVNPASAIGKLRILTGLDGFDLPTEAQWEYLCRAATTTYYNDGNELAPDDGMSIDPAVSNSFMDAVGWYKHNTSVKQAVGQKRPNAWGLYDTHGNVWEWCLDWPQVILTGGANPAGAVTGTRRVWRGGGYQDTASLCESSVRGSYFPDYRQATRGFRLILKLP
jgi:formylglycine-generating enzyme required for sulfatase activity